MRNIQLVIPAAGLGSRFRDAGYSTSKPLIPVGKVQMILWVISNFNLIEGDDLILISRSEDDLEIVRSIIPKFVNYINIQLNEITDGPAVTVQKASNYFDPKKSLIVANSDQYVSSPLSEFLNKVRFGEMEGLILTMLASSNKWSYVSRDSLGFVSQVVEKLEISKEATVGIYAWKSPRFFIESFEQMQKANDRVNGELYVAPTYNYLIKNGGKVNAVSVGKVSQTVHGLGTPEDLEIFLSNPSFGKWEEALTNIDN